MQVEWVEEQKLVVIFYAKDKGTFKSTAWNREYNPDLTFATSNEDGQPMHMSRKVISDFPKSQHPPY